LNEGMNNPRRQIRQISRLGSRIRRQPTEASSRETWRPEGSQLRKRCKQT
jgi:hypothetical protein